jgi:hypothetical protein
VASKRSSPDPSPNRRLDLAAPAGRAWRHIEAAEVWIGATFGENEVLSIEGARSCGADGDAGSGSSTASCPAKTLEDARAGASCGGTVGCDGSCSVQVPANPGQPCGGCGGVVECDGSCSAPGPADVGEAGGAGGAGIDCSGVCSVATPSDYDSNRVRDTPDRFSCCFVDEGIGYGPGGRDTSAIRATLTPVDAVEGLFTSAALHCATWVAAVTGRGLPRPSGAACLGDDPTDSRAGRLRRMRSAASDFSTPAKAGGPA